MLARQDVQNMLHASSMNTNIGVGTAIDMLNKNLTIQN